MSKNPRAPVPPPSPVPPSEPGGTAPLGTVQAAIITATMLVAAGVALYLLRAFLHKTYGTESFDSACNFNETFNCDKINTSTWGKIAGIPITVFAVPAYAALAVLAWMATRVGDGARAAHRLLLVGTAGSVAYGVFLLYVMAFIEQTFCVFCMTMDAMALVAFVTAWMTRKRALGSLALGAPLGAAAATGLLALGGSFAYHGATKEALLAQTVAAVDAAGAGAGAGSAGGAPPNATGQARKVTANQYEVPVSADDPSKGPRDAKVTVVEYADFQCGYCKKLFYALVPLKEKYKDDVQFVFKNFPMNTKCNDKIKNDRHKWACGAAVAGQCAHRQGRFWEMHDLMFKNQHKLEPDDLRWYAQQVGLDMGAFDQCSKDPAAMARVKQDISSGGQLELDGTPRTFINGRLFKGAQATEVMDHVIRQALGQAIPGEKAQPVAPQAPAPPITAAAAPPMAQPSIAGKSFWIDSFEASIDASGKALSLPAVAPANATWFEAKAACEKAGKRLCTSEEWVSACQNASAVDDDHNGNFADDYVEGNQYPFADWYDAGMCRDSEDKAAGHPGLTGGMARCVTPGGVFDLAGNVQEWVGASEGEAMLLGGDFAVGDHADCYRPNNTFGPGHRNQGIGFRCCADASVANASAKAVDKVAPNDVVGKKLPSFIGDLLDGGTTSSASWKGKVTYLTFFASWCGPCQRELPELMALNTRFAGKGFQVISVGVDTDPKKSEAFARKVGLDYPVIVDPKGEILGQFDVKSMPTTYIIGKDGTIKHKQVGFGDKTIADVTPIIEGLL